MSDTIVVTGANGMLGRAIVGLLSMTPGEHEVVALGHAELDITDDQRVLAEIGRLKPAAIINCAAYTKVDEAEQEHHLALAVNSRGVRNLALAAQQNHSFICHFSSDYIFDGKKGEPYREWDEHWPLNYYGMSKQGGEEMLASIWDGHLIIRTSWLYGPGGKNFVDTVRQKLAAGESLSVVNDQFGAPTYVGDLAAAAVYLVDLRARGKYHYSNDAGAAGVSWYEVAREIAGILGYDAALIKPVTTAQIEQAALRPVRSVLGLNKVKELIPSLVRPWQEALRDYLTLR
ncbi:MAG: dTDP-4-dehydrorhamnose reductase [Deltaproteobacteria bacterium]|nr:dTDP-4-dehydrorhamnose reductase [Candidatus Anaeroferrophillus wilburensis]MBN2888380.1 dTDP-4-dehydrorhamnose reductase [Deltaproteobacteria bacterium]